VRISQKLEYACRALAQLAKRHDGRTITRLEELAQREAVSANFLVQILNDLRRGGLVASRRGKAGGYLLAKQPGSINLAEIADAVDPSLLPNSVSNDGESGPAVREAWEDVTQSLRAKLESISLEQLTQTSGGPMFYI
jgi:Rrf2 family protein